MINFWSSLEDYSFAAWRISFPIDQAEEMMVKYVAFVDEFINSSIRYKILIPVLADGNATINKEGVVPLVRYKEKVVEVYKKEGDFYFLNYYNFSSKHLDKPIFTPSEIFYYTSDGSIVSDCVIDAGEILKGTTFSLGEKDDIAQGYIESSPPISIYSTGFSKHSRYKPDDRLSLNISLNTNIWFPYITSPFSLSKDFRLGNGWIDNIELARRHSVNFNSWFKEVVDSAEKIYGKIAVDRSDSFGKKYRPMVTEAGIDLDIDWRDLGMV